MKFVIVIEIILFYFPLNKACLMKGDNAMFLNIKIRL